MTIQNIDVGQSANDKTGDSLREGGIKANENFGVLNNLVNQIISDLVNCITNSSLTVTLANYVTSLSLATTLADYAKLAVAQSFTKAQRVTPVALSSSGGSIAIDFALSNNFSHTLTENTTLANPTNCVAGQSGQITITQHASAAKTLGFGSNWKSADGTAQTVSTTLSAVNLLTYYVNSPTHISFSLIKHGVA